MGQNRLFNVFAVAVLTVIVVSFILEYAEILSVENATLFLFIAVSAISWLVLWIKKRQPSVLATKTKRRG